MNTIRRVLMFLLVPALVPAQQLVLDWSTRSLSCPAETGGAGAATLEIRSVNDVLYTYRIDANVKPVEPNDFGNFVRALTVTSCDEKLAAAEAALLKVKTSMGANSSLTPAPDAKTGKYLSVPIATTQAAWNVMEAGDMKAFRAAMRDLESCAFGGEVNPAERKAMLLRELGTLEAYAGRVAGAHTIRQTVSLATGVDNEFTVTVSERVGSASTYLADGKEESTLTKTCTMKAGVLSLSAGVLFSTVPSREYKVSPVPKGASMPCPDGSTTCFQQQNETYNAYTVNNANNLNPLGAALLNYRLPLPGSLRPHWWGLAVSTGPTFRIGGTATNVSSFGWFSGVSVHLWNRLFLTPGFHVGQFADFPVGYSQNSYAPSSIPTPEPVKRWTARFGLALTVRTNNFDAINFKPVRVAETPQPAETPKPAAAPKSSETTNGGGFSTQPSKGEESSKPAEKKQQQGPRQ